MDRLSQLRGEAGSSRDSTLDTTSPPSESYMTANESSSKYYSLSEVESTFDISTIKDDISSIKDVSLASTTTESEGTLTNADELISNLSPIGKKSDSLDSFKIDTQQIEAANILSGGVAIFDDNDNSYDGHELVIDDNVEVDDKTNSEPKQPESLQFKTDDNIIKSSLISEEADIASKDTEVVLQIDGKNVDAIDIGNGLYLYRKEGQEELAAVQIIDDNQQQPSFKFLKVRENAEGNLEVYEEIEIEVPKEVPVKEGKMVDKNTATLVPIKDINKVISESSCNKVAAKKIKAPRKDQTSTTTVDVTENKEPSPDNKSELNLNGKMMKFSESRKSPVIGSYTPMTYHSTPKKEGIPLTKTMVDQQLHPNRHYDMSNIKKTIEVHTDSCKQKPIETSPKTKDIDDNKLNKINSTSKEDINVNQIEKVIVTDEENDPVIIDIKTSCDNIADTAQTEPNKSEEQVDNKIITKNIPDQSINVLMEQDDVDSTEKNTKVKSKQVCIEMNDDKNMEEFVIVSETEVDTLEKKDKVVEIDVEKKLVVEENIQLNEEVLEEIIEVDSEGDEGKEEQIEIDDETEPLTVNAPCVKESKELIEKNINLEQNETETIEDKTRIVSDDEPILIEDDDVSIVEEAIVDSEEGAEKVVNKPEEKIVENKDTGKVVDNITSVSGDPKNDVVSHKKVESTDAVVKEIIADSSSAQNATQSESKKDSPQPVEQEVKSVVVARTMEIIDVADSTLPTEPIKDTLTSAEVETTASKDIKIKGKEKQTEVLLTTNKPDPVALQLKLYEEKQDAQDPKQFEETKKLVQPVYMSTDIQNQATQHSQVTKNIPIPTPQTAQVSKVKQNLPSHNLPKVVDTMQDRKPTQSLVLKDTMQDRKPTQSLVLKDTTPKLIPSANLSSQPESNKQSSIQQHESIVTQKIGIKNLTVQNPPFKVTTQKIERKVPEMTSKKDPVKHQSQVREFLPTVAQMRADSCIPKAITQAINAKDKILSKEESTSKAQKDFLPIKDTTGQPLSVDVKRSNVSRRDEIKDTKLSVKEIGSDRGKGFMNIEISKVPKHESAKPNNPVKQDVSSTSSKVTSESVKNKVEPYKDNNKEMPKTVETKPINNNHAAVPFGKWTEANRQEFLNKFKTKTSVISTNSNQLKNSNDLNRRDVLKKIDSQRSNNALTKTQEANKLSMKPETAAFSNKPNIVSKESVHESQQITEQPETVEVKSTTMSPKYSSKVEALTKTESEISHTATATAAAKTEACQRTGVVQNLIDKTIEGMIHRNTTPKTQDETNMNKNSDASKSTKSQETYQPIEQATLDAIEIKMNELHGIPFIERPPHELPQVHKSELKTYSKSDKEKTAVQPKTKIPNLLPFSNKTQQKVAKESVIEVDSEDEIIEHEPITGDIISNNKNQVLKPTAKEHLPSNTSPQIQQDKIVTDAAKKEAIITEKDFDKFARRNSMTYENCLTVNFDGKEPHNVIQTVVKKDPCPKSYSKIDNARNDPKSKLSQKYQTVRPNTQIENKFVPANEDSSNRNKSKLQKAYHSALTAKRQMATESPITIIEDKPVKVVFMDSVDYVPGQLNVQGQDLSPAKRPILESDITVSTCDSLDSELLESVEDAKSQDEVKTKTKHQRKQVLTPVDEPELELIEPRVLGIEVSPKKKRKTEDDKTDKTVKYPMRKKFYLLSSSTATEEKVANPVEIIKNPLKETVILNDNVVVHNTVSALDSLVKAAELIETQTKNINTSIVSNPDSQQNTPVKRGRGRPRKYPLTPDGTVDKPKVISAPSPQKRPRLIDAKPPKHDTFSDDSDTDDDAIIKENWTMGKINENIVCPICNKLFRSENVVFKHVKHCTGPSPSRSDSDKRSPRRTRISQDFDTQSRESKSDDMDIDDDKPLITRKETPKKRKSKDPIIKLEDKDDVIVIEDTPIKEKPEKIDERKHHESRKPRPKIPPKSNDLVCEFCGKTFRQLSYLVSHKLQHKKKVEPKKIEKENPVNKSVYSCEVCKKEFRKLHHLVQHRIIHNPSSVQPRASRKSSSEPVESKVEKEPTVARQNEDPSAGFRCEPCDKSFRKLHHLVEHRETHDGINRQKTATAPPSKEEKVVEKPVIIHQCDVCKKTFRKLQHLSEHRESHVETSSEKSDDKSVKSSLSTKDIIHECSLCYMVFPNEHSLTKHTVICLRKKRQSKQAKPADGPEASDEIIESPLPEDKIEIVDSPIHTLVDSKKYEEKLDSVNKLELTEETARPVEVEVRKETYVEPVKLEEEVKVSQKVETKIAEKQVLSLKRDFVETVTAITEAISEVPEKIKKIGVKEPDKTHETPKKKAVKIPNKRVKVSMVPTPAAEEVKAAESSDDDEVRYMLNPNFKHEQVSEEKIFLKVRAKKRSSLQIERPNSKDLVKRRTSLQHPPKIPRLKPKVLETTSTTKKEIKPPKVEPVPSTDSDDSETTKYSFPSTIPDKPTKPAQDRTPKDSEKKVQKKSLADKRKSLSGIAKRKSLGQAVIARHKVSPSKPIKKRTLDISHRCDCGQLFSSAALLARHTSLAHTPPRVRRCRDPPASPQPDRPASPQPDRPASPQPDRPASPQPDRPARLAPDRPTHATGARKSSARSDSSTSTKPTKIELKGKKTLPLETPSDRKRKLDKSETKSSVKTRTAAHRGVPVPDKMRKLMQKNK